ncbi:transposase IS3/IS911 family protein [Caballeronia terrestris]|uniref:Transposase IS3/IS911 family protein n=1 Tax=Caballeronia terrestris TaxID=1226301 RepID=A0A158KRB9_9BURK|nr:transposase IS3/IS911 family protein [Caballeronia terrestris]
MFRKIEERRSLANWVRAAKAGRLGKVGQQQKPLTELEMELNRVKRELAEVKMERDLLKFATYFAKESR